jgi:hypothetical protein
MSKPKTVSATIKLLINAGQAKPAPPVGPALGQAGLNIMNFCKDFNAKTSMYRVSLVAHCQSFVLEPNTTLVLSYCLRGLPSSLIVHLAFTGCRRMSLCQSSSPHTLIKRSNTYALRCKKPLHAVCCVCWVRAVTWCGQTC